MSGGRREVAVRVFATEYDDAEHEYAESDEERAPKYIVTPGGARINRLFVVGVLTSVERINDETVRARVADPTGAFVIYAGQYQPEELAFLERAEPPMFVAVTGKANAFRPDGSDRVLTSIRPEQINEVDADTRDRWVISTAQQTLDRIEQMAQTLDQADRDDADDTIESGETANRVTAGIKRALDYYETGPDYLGELRRVAIQALEIVADERDEIAPVDIEPADRTGSYTVDTLTDLTTANKEIEIGKAQDDTLESSADSGETLMNDVSDESTATEEPKETIEKESIEQEPTGEKHITDTTTEPTEDSDEEEVSDTGAVEDIDESITGDPDELYQVDEEERERIKEEHGLEFSSGNDVDDPESTDESSPDTESASTMAQPTTEEVREEGSVEEEVNEESIEEDVDVADVQARLLDQMDALDENNGVDTDELIEVVMDETSATRDAIEEAIEEALMSGKCYEPEDGRLKRI